MDDGQQDQYEERLKEVFESFDASGAGSLCPEELSDLCQALHLEDSTPALLHALLQNQDRLTGRVGFDQFKNALILVLSTSIAATLEPSQETARAPLSPDSPVQAKFVRGSKRYGRHSTPEFIDAITDFSEAVSSNATGRDPEDHEDSTVPRKRERWNAHESGTEEYEAEGQLHLWNPDEPSTPRVSITPLSDHLEERFREACEELAMPWDGCASHHELLALCDHLGLEVTEDVLQVLSGDEIMSVQAFTSWVLNHAKPPTPSASTPYRQLKRLHSSQPFDETGRRTSAMTSTIGMRLFSTLDDGTGSAPAEDVLDAWMEEGVENTTEILQALDFDLEGKVNLRELTVALENELLMTKNGIHQAALASFKAEIRYLLERADRELREKEKTRSDLEKAEKLKTQLATEVDEHHSAIERMNDLNLRKLEQEHREKLVSVRSELIKEMDQIQQQTGLQREKLETEMEKLRDDETFLRDHLSLTVKESRRLEMELLDSTEKLVEAENQVSKLQRNLDNILKEKFGDLDLGSAEFFLQEESLRRLRISYEEQCRELQDRIDELQAELQEYHNLGRTSQPCLKPSLSEDLESKSPGMESDPGLGSEEGQPLFNMSLEAEMMLEQLKEKHLLEMNDLQAQLESKVSEFDQKVEEQKADLEAQKVALSLQYLEEIQALRGEMSIIQNRALELQAQLENAEEERAGLEQRQAGVKEELEHQEEEVSSLRQELLESRIQVSDLEEQLKVQQAKAELGLDTEMQELRKLHALELNKLDVQHDSILQVRLEEEKGKLQEELEKVERKLLEEWEREKRELQQSHEEAMKARIEEVSLKFQAEREELEMRLTEEWEREKAQLDEQSNESLQTVLEEEMLRLVKEQDGREIRLTEQWELEQVQLKECLEETLLTRLAEEKLKQQEQQEEVERRLREDWDRERLQLEEDYEGMLQEQLQEDRERLAGEKEEVEKRLEQMMEEEKERLEEAHRQAVQELSAKHSEEREQLSGLLDKLREDIAEERNEAGRLAEENLLLRHKISVLKEEDLRETREETLLKLEHFRKEKISAQKKAESFKRQISELRLRSQQLEDENGLLSEKNAQNAAGVEGLSQQLGELLRQSERQEAVRDQQHFVPEDNRTKMAVCASALEAELTNAVEGTVLPEEGKAQLVLQINTLRDKVAKMGAVECQLSLLLQEHKALEKQAQGLRNQLAKSQERTHVLDESLQSVNLQSARLKSDLRVSQQEKDALKQEVMSLHKQLQNANDKNQVLEMALHSSGYQSQHKKLYQDELARLVEQEQQLLRQENERLTMELHNVKDDLHRSRDKTRQLEAAILTVKQQKQQGQASVVKTVEQEKTALKRELDMMHQELLSAQNKVCEVQRELESLRQENEGLKTQQTQLQTLQVQLVGLLPTSPRRMPGERREQHRRDDLNPENIQGAAMPEQRAAHADSYRRIGGL
ncbi:ninein [Salvelinus namaycush]|uniref:Ninein n=1 Tax=Salvelinus namaycush TaxID=8040 RepID=A0A8U1GVE9_SALNM|nr:ninein [Salvelinus namaycush]